MDELTKSYLDQGLNAVSFDFIDEVSDEGSICSTTHDETCITSVSFKIQAVEFSGQYDADNAGIYALRLKKVEDYDSLLNYLRIESVESLTPEPDKVMKILITMTNGLQLSTYYSGTSYLLGSIRVENYRDSIPALLGLSRM